MHTMHIISLLTIAVTSDELTNNTGQTVNSTVRLMQSTCMHADMHACRIKVTCLELMALKRFMQVLDYPFFFIVSQKVMLAKTLASIL